MKQTEMRTNFNIRFIIMIFLGYTLSTITVYAQQKDEDKNLNISAEKKKDIIKTLCDRLDTVYLYPENVNTIRKYLTEKMDQGGYTKVKTPADFAFQLDADLQYITNDKHMGIVYDPKKAAEMISQPTENYYTKEVIDAFRQTNFEFRELKILEGNIGYMDLREFCPVKYAGETAVAAMNFLSNCSALIIDLRNNGGGDDNMVQFLLSYLLDGDIQFSTSFNRFTNSYYISQTFPYVPGKKLYDIPLYILISKSTFSGAEAFSYNLKAMKRATLIGENTRGGENPIEIQVLNNDYIAYIPAVKIIKSIAKTTIRWENIGIKPDIETDVKDALFTAQIKALEELSVKNISNKASYQWILDGIKSRQNQFVADKEVLKSYAGNYGERKLIFESGTLFYQRNGTVKSKLIATDSDSFLVDGIDYLRLKMLKENGKVIGLIRFYNDGTSRQDLKDK
ncbi:MAG TPA: S41 family peptidase [Paludibacter sp.]|nr:S41 family peptidase [Paludibacter sp.]